MPQVSVYSKVFLDGDTSWCATPSRELLRRIHAQGESARWVVVIPGHGKIALGDPCAMEGESLFMPPWFNGLEDGMEIQVEFERSEDIPRATRLVFKTIGEIPEWLDVREILEEPLSQLGVLSPGQLIPVPVAEGVMLQLDVCEPAEPFVFMDGAEVALEVLDSAVAEVNAPVPVPQPEPEPFDFSSMIPAPAPQSGVKTPWSQAAPQSFQGKGNTLGRH